MTEVVSVRFKNRGKLYFFHANGLDIADGTPVVVETAKGLELGEGVYGNHWVSDDRIVPPLRPVLRCATEEDLKIVQAHKLREKEAFAICQKKIAAHGLEMKLVNVECNFEGNKIVFFFASEGRVDFRDLVKDLAGVFRTRIELRQIGVRDEAKMLGGLGICGRPFCCSQFLDDFAPVSTKMAKTQSMSLNPAKISGSCGRLMCCLRYEQEAYEELVKTVPKNGAFVQTTQGYGNVTQVNLLRQKVKVRLDGTDQSLKVFDADEVAAVPGGRPKPGDPLPSVLVIKPKAAPEAEAATEMPSSAPRRELRPEARSEMRRDTRSEPRRDVRHAPKPSESAPAQAEKPEKTGENASEQAPKPRRRSRNRKPKAPAQDNAVQQAAKPTEKKPQPEKKEKALPHQKAKKPQPQPQQENGAQPQPASDSADGAKKADGRRRYYRRKKPGAGPKGE